jgi:hypothetical protein
MNFRHAGKFGLADLLMMLAIVLFSSLASVVYGCQTLGLGTGVSSLQGYSAGVYQRSCKDMRGGIGVVTV